MKQSTHSLLIVGFTLLIIVIVALAFSGKREQRDGMGVEIAGAGADTPAIRGK